MTYIPSVGHLIPAMRSAEAERSRRWNESLAAVGITEAMELAIVPADLGKKGMIGGLKAMNQHQDILILAVSEAQTSGKAMTLDRLREIATDYREARTLRGRLKRRFSRKYRHQEI
jgi:hypothetical protein